MREGSRNYPFEALAEVTNSDWEASRGELNVALKSIRAQAEIDDDYLLAAEINERAKLYRQVMGEDVLLTPTALAKHWLRVLQESETRRRTRGVNLSVERSAPLPPKQSPPEWVSVWFWARNGRKPRNMLPFPQQGDYIDPTKALTTDAYEALREEWIQAGSPGFDLRSLVDAVAKRNYASEVAEVLREVNS